MTDRFIISEEDAARMQDFAAKRIRHHVAAAVERFSSGRVLLFHGDVINLKYTVRFETPKKRGRSVEENSVSCVEDTGGGL
jgi:hypothetical protein